MAFKLVSWCYFLLLLVSVRLEGAVLARDLPPEQRPLQLVPGPTAVSPDTPQLLVSLANGQLVALHQDTGAVLWTFDTGAPLLSSANPAVMVASDAEGVPKDGIFPGTDGSLYVYRGIDDGAPRIEKLPISVRDLVDASPAPAPDGSLVLGTQRSTVFVIDALRGALLRTLRGSDGERALLEDATVLTGLALGDAPSLAAADAADGGESDSDNADPQLQQQQQQVVVAIGRKDYVVRAVHPAFGEQWNVTWSHLFRLSELDVRRVKSPPGGASARGEARFDLLVGADHSLRRYDPEAGWEAWARKFEAPPLAAYPAAGGSIDLLGGSRRPPTEAAPPAGALAPGTAGRDAVAVGLMAGGLFGVPASRLVLMAAQQCSAGAAAGEDQCAPGGVDDPSEMSNARLGARAVAAVAAADAAPPPVQRGGGIDASTALALPYLQQQQRERWWAQEVCASGDGDTCAVTLGTFALHQPLGEPTLVFLPESPAAPLSTAQQQQPATVGSSGVPLVVVLAVGMAGGGAAAVGVVGLRRRRAAGRAAARVAAASAAASGGGGGGAVAGAAVSGLPTNTTANKRGKRKKQGGAAGKEPAPAGEPGPAEAALATGEVAELKGRQGNAALANGAAGPAALAEAAEAEAEEAGQQGTTEAAGAETPPPPEKHASPASAAPSAARQPREGVDGAIHVGRLRVGPAILGYGSGGTLVFDGLLDGRPVAVKRLLRQFVELARKEIGALILSDAHPNVVRCLTMEEDSQFVYLALERCAGTLADAMAAPGGRHRFVDGATGRPTPEAVRMAEDIGRGVAALHARGIVHRDLKPHNVLLTEDGRVKVSDMGLSKRLVPEQASFETAGGAGGSPGWQAPEQLITRGGGAARQTAAVDVFSYALLIHYCLTGGLHPYGEGFERDANILAGRCSLSALSSQPEAANLVQGMLASDPGARPAMPGVMAHPLWWGVDRRLAFLIDVSDRVEGEDRAEDRTLYASLEALSPQAVGPGGSWAAALDSGLVNNLGKYRRYDYSSMRDLLRVIRNKHSHFREMPPELQRRLGPLPAGFLDYFASRFPQLLTACFFFALRWCAEEPVFAKYFAVGAGALLETLAPPAIKDPSPAALEARRAAQRAMQALPPPPDISAPFGGAISDAASGSAASSPAAALAGPAPKTPGGGKSLGPRPDRSTTPSAVGPAAEGDGAPLFPRRPGLPLCDFFSKTGHCRFGEACRFDHPPEFGVRLNSRGLPMRPGQVACAHYERWGECKYGKSCKWDHPEKRQ